MTRHERTVRWNIAMLLVLGLAVLMYFLLPTSPLTVFLPGYIATETYDQVQPGMSHAEVRHILGKPTRILGPSKWVPYPGWQWLRLDQDIEVYFQDDRVTSKHIDD